MRGGGKFKDALNQVVRKAAGGKVRVGIIEEAHYENGQSMAQAAYWNEYGTAHIKPRPFFRQSIAKHQGEWADKAARLMRENGGDVKQTLIEVGGDIKGDIMETIRDFREPPNEDATVRKKGFDDPLIENADLWRSIHYEVEE